MSKDPRDSIRKARVLVTGASSGIGAATARAFCHAGAKEVVAIARRSERLQELAATWADETGGHVVPVQLDITDREAVERLAGQHPELFAADVLVNNAGLARGKGPIQAGRFEDWEEMVDTNIKGLLSMTERALPHMVQKGRGDIVHVGSVAGRWSYPGGNVYCGTKAFVGHLTEAMRLDLNGSGVRVTNIEPGLVETEFSEVRYKGDKAKAAKVYEGYTPLSPDDVAQTILWCVQRPAHVNVQELVLYPTDQGGIATVAKHDD